MITKYYLLELKDMVQTVTIIKRILICLLQITFHTVIVNKYDAKNNSSPFPLTGYDGR